MKQSNQKRVLGLSLVTALLLGSSAYAGLIKTNAGDPATASSNRVDGFQYGFDGWNFDNVDVRIVDVDDFTGDVGTFDTDSGEYTGLGDGKSFESDVWDSDQKNEILGHVHGKDWPVGEPAGVKVINGDTKVKHGKPVNCIMTSSYLAYQDMDNNESGSGYLDTTHIDGPQPVICSSPFQTHKRYKIDMLPETVADVNDTTGGYGKSIDLVFNLEPGDISAQRYQVLQKINNYTDKRLDGYKMEVLDENGTVKSVLNLSLGAGEGDEGADIWGIEDMANMSHGLWGPADDNFPVPGFFDDVRAYYPVTLAANTIEYNGEMQGGNYQELFGNWLPSIWEPQAIFFDDDNDPETDAVLMAFWGDPLNTGTNAWHKGKDYDLTDGDQSWAEPTDTEFLQWSTSPAYNVGGVEDVLNLGINYIIEVGDNAQIGSTFTLRVTPHIGANDQTPPAYVDDNGSVIPEPPVITDGTVAISPAPTFLIGTTLILSVKDEDQNLDPAVKDTTTVEVTTDTGDKETVTLTEAEVDNAIFTATIASELTSSSPAAGDGKVNVIKDAVVTVSYEDDEHFDTASTKATVIEVDDGDDAEDSDGNTASSGGGCTYNPNSKNFDMTFLLMMALGLFYPFRRRFIK